MCIGLAIGHPCYEVLRDFGSPIVGLFAVVAALWAARATYRSAIKQVEATATATNDRINALRTQEDRQAENVREAVQIEITTMVTGVINVANLLGPLRKGGQTLLPQTREIIARSLITPTIYPAIADRVGLLHDPYPVVIFYSKVATARSFITSSWLDEMGRASDFLGLSLVTLQEALLLARPIVAGEIFGGQRLDHTRREHTTSEIDACLRNIFGVDPKAAAR
jgi:hypothetical protein